MTIKNAILVLNRALDSDRDNISLIKELAFAYYLQKDYTRGINAIKPVVDSRSSDDQSYQILGMLYRAIDNRRGS